MIKADFLHH